MQDCGKEVYNSNNQNFFLGKKNELLVLGFLQGPASVVAMGT